jgi:ABC-type proline/glycine betaine transport system ATPase subunit
VFATIIPSIIVGKLLIGPVIICLAIGIFCICDNIIFVKRMKKWEQAKTDKKNRDKRK